MFSNGNVVNYKGFGNFNISNLKRITLIGGKNNVGKTSLLEAMFMFVDRLNAAMIIRQFGWRGVNSIPIHDAKKLWEPIFHGYDIKKPIQITMVRDGLPETMEIAFNENFSQQVILNESNEAGQKVRTDQVPFYSYSLDVKYKKSGKIDDEISHFLVRPDGIQLRVDKGSPYPNSATFLAAKAQSNPLENAVKFGQLEVEGKTQLVLSALQVIEPRLKGLSSVTLSDGLSMVYGDIGLEKKIPLPYMGDGISRLLSIILAIINSKNGTVFIDEIENGIHFTTLPDIWKVIAIAANENNCQVFTTTHSYECLQSAISGIPKDHRNDFMYVRLDREEGGDNRLICNNLDFDTLTLALEHNWEVR